MVQQPMCCKAWLIHAFSYGELYWRSNGSISWSLADAITPYGCLELFPS